MRLIQLKLRSMTPREKILRDAIYKEKQISEIGIINLQNIDNERMEQYQRTRDRMDAVLEQADAIKDEPSAADAGRLRRVLNKFPLGEYVGYDDIEWMGNYLKRYMGIE